MTMTKEQTFDIKSTIMLRNLFLFSLQKATEKTRLSSAQRHEGALKNLNDTRAK